MRLPSYHAVCVAVLGLFSCALAATFSRQTARFETTLTLSQVTEPPRIAFEKNGPEDYSVDVPITTTLPGKTGPKTALLHYDPVYEVVQPAIAYNIPLYNSSDLLDAAASNLVGAACFYPVGSFYIELPRIIFYGTVVFAVLARAHPWLVVGSLAASLTYSGTAAIHGMINLWSGHYAGNLDLYPIYGIVTFSIAMLVPLLTWSKTIRTLGAEREEDASGRPIIILWAILIFIASASFFAILVNPSDGHNNWSFTFSTAESFSCVPESGVMDFMAGQGKDWPTFVPTIEFLEANGCLDPCKDGPTWAFTRDPNDLQPPTVKQANVIWNWGEDERVLTRGQRVGVGFSNAFILVGCISTMWIILQGILAILFGRRSPKESRNLIYVGLALFFSRQKEQNFQVESHPIAHKLSKTVAYTYYISVFFSSVFSVLLAVSAVIATEFICHELPAGAQMYEVDSWAPYVATGLVLFASMFAQFQAILEDLVLRSLNAVTWGISRCLHGRRKAQRDYTSTSDGSAFRDYSSDSEPLGEYFRASLARMRKRVGGWKTSWRESWEDNKMFWQDSWTYARLNREKVHMPRRLPGRESRTSNAGDDQGFEEVERTQTWQTTETLIGSNMEKSDRKEEPPVASRTQDRYRTQFNWTQFWGIFSRGNSSHAPQRELNYPGSYQGLSGEEEVGRTGS